jgi:hypothetical protein
VPEEAWPVVDRPTKTEIYFPNLIVGRVFDEPRLTWPVNWFDKISITEWPPLIDIDRLPFLAWDKRIGR